MQRGVTRRGGSPAMRLLLACCRWPADPALVMSLQAGVEWAQFVTLARRHRVQGLVHRALLAAGVAEAAMLADDARRIAREDLRLAAETVRLYRLLAAAAVPTLAIKGVALGALAYGALGVKMGWDIDLLIAPERVATAGAVLEAAGYACVLPEPGEVALAAWHAFSKESVWRHRVSGIHVELHTALLDHPQLLPGVDARSPARTVTLSPGLSVPTLQDDVLFAYLCLHGAASGWRRAKWLADLAACLALGDGERMHGLYDRAQALGAGRAAGQGLLLCARHLGTRLPPALAATLRRDRAARLLAWSAGRLMTAEDGYDDPAETMWGTLPIHLQQFLLLPGWGYKAGELTRKLRPDPRHGDVGRLRYAWRVVRRWREDARTAAVRRG